MRWGNVMTSIARIPGVQDWSVLSGEIDLLVQIEAAAFERVNEIWAMISAMDEVQNMTTCFVLNSALDKS